MNFLLLPKGNILFHVIILSETLFFSCQNILLICLTAFYHSKIHPNYLYSFIAFPNFCRTISALVPSLNLLHGFNNHLYSGETISRLFYWNMSSSRASIVIDSVVFQASHTLFDGEHVKKKSTPSSQVSGFFSIGFFHLLGL